MRVRREDRIPKIIHHIWTSGDPLWPEWQELRLTWMRNNPEYTFVFWTQKDFEYHKYSDISRLILEEDAFWELKFDVVTWEILRLYGGIKTDNDMECRKSFDPLLKYSSFAAKNWSHCTMGVQLVGMSPNNELAPQISNAVCTAILKNYKKANSGKIWKYTDYPAYPFLSQCDCVLPKEAFNPFSWDELFVGGHSSSGKVIAKPQDKITKLIKDNNGYPDSYAIHYWGAQFAGGWNVIMKNRSTDQRKELL